MKTCVVALAVVATVCASAAAAEPAVVFEDTFDGKLARGWTWIKESKDAWRIKDGGLEFRVLPGKENILAVEVPRQGAYAVEVTLTSVPQPTRQYEQGGFGWYHEDKQSFKYVKELIDGKTYVFPGKKEMPAATIQLRLEVRGGKFTAHFRPDAKGEPRPAFSGTLPAGGKGRHRVSLMCYNGPKDADHWMRFDNFRIVKLAE